MGILCSKPKGEIILIVKNIIPQGYVEYEMSHKELKAKLVAGDWCDCCNDYMRPEDPAHLIPVLAMRTYCQDCFDKWKKNAIFYEEDLLYEQDLVRKLDKIFDL